jgi:hypothetical protein
LKISIPPHKTVKSNYCITNLDHDSDLEHSFQLIGELTATLCLELPPTKSKTQSKRIENKQMHFASKQLHECCYPTKGRKIWTMQIKTYHHHTHSVYKKVPQVLTFPRPTLTFFEQTNCRFQDPISGASNLLVKFKNLPYENQATAVSQSSKIMEMV